jgi:threonine synthase
MTRQEKKSLGEWLVDQGIITKEQRTVVISTAHGLKFSKFKVDYHQGLLPDMVAEYRNPPVELPADYVLVQKKIQQHFMS